MNFLKKLFGSRPDSATPVADSCCNVGHDKAKPRSLVANGEGAAAVDSADGVCETHACTPAVAERPTVHAEKHAAGHGCCE